MKTVAALSLSIWLVSMVIGTAAQPAVLDTDGQPLQSGVEYYVLPGITDVAGGLTLVDPNDSCPLYVGQEPIAPVVSQGFPVIFKPFADGETIIRESRDLTVTFQAGSVCVQSTAWTVGKVNPETGRRYIVTAGEADYFNIRKNGGVYNFVWCPAESCPTCGRPRCGSAGIVIENDKRLLVLDGPAFPFRFRRV
ncbi:kunitz type trypsin inhibitor 111 [Ricinus communis]|uniref:Miraculin, putative n=1 Tax=Ricinus communis TaxID=3988 RepID=B9SIQ4_RICCO|nr:kunitz type trypsin inhibitor 111 [Ricinus communis]EEF36477.1 Miraculin precursor, putative [Ricinus communis]|eukprot:XP_002525873.1 miraculin [Ricinus communis]